MYLFTFSIHQPGAREARTAGSSRREFYVLSVCQYALTTLALQQASVVLCCLRELKVSSRVFGKLPLTRSTK